MKNSVWWWVWEGVFSYVGGVGRHIRDRGGSVRTGIGCWDGWMVVSVGLVFGHLLRVPHYFHYVPPGSLTN